MKKQIVLLILTASILLTGSVRAELNVVTTTADLEDIVRQIGGEHVTVHSLSDGSQDPHFVEPRPSMIVKLRNADLVVQVGMDLDIWFQSLTDAAKNPSIQKGRDGFLDASLNIRKLEIPTGRVDGSLGHVHPQGNPHYWLDPENAKRMAADIAGRLKKLDPDHAKDFETNLNNFNAAIDSHLTEWQKRLESVRNRKLVSYHASWIYFANRFGLTIVDELEPKPGIPPSPKHLSEVIKTMQADHVKAVLIETFYDEKPARFVADQTGATVVRVANSVGGSKDAVDYIGMIDAIVAGLEKAME